MLILHPQQSYYWSWQKKLNIKASFLSDTQKEDIALLSIMESRKDEEALLVSKTYDTLRKIR